MSKFKTQHCELCRFSETKIGMSLYCKLSGEKIRFFKPKTVYDSSYGFNKKCNKFENAT